MITEQRIADLFQIQERFLRSSHLERDFTNPECLNAYIPTPHARAAIRRLTSGLSPRSAQRAWRITGDYGTGKSSFALTLAHLLSRRRLDLPSHIADLLDPEDVRTGELRLVPVLVTASHQPLAASLC